MPCDHQCHQTLSLYYPEYHCTRNIKLKLFALWSEFVNLFEFQKFYVLSSSWSVHVWNVLALEFVLNCSFACGMPIYVSLLGFLKVCIWYVWELKTPLLQFPLLLHYHLLPISLSVTGIYQFSPFLSHPFQRLLIMPNTGHTLQE